MHQDVHVDHGHHHRAHDGDDDQEPVVPVGRHGDRARVPGRRSAFSFVSLARARTPGARAVPPSSAGNGDGRGHASRRARSPRASPSVRRRSRRARVCDSGPRRCHKRHAPVSKIASATGFSAFSHLKRRLSRQQTTRGVPRAPLGAHFVTRSAGAVVGCDGRVARAKGSEAKPPRRCLARRR